MKKDAKIKADRFLQNRGNPDFSREEYRQIEQKLFAGGRQSPQKNVARPRAWSGVRRHAPSIAGVLLLLAVVLPVVLFLIRKDKVEQRHFSERGGPVFETFAIRPNNTDEPSIRSLQGIEIVNLDEYLQFRAPAQVGCENAAIFGIDETYQVHYYFPKSTDSGGFELNMQGDTYSPGSVRLSAGHHPGYLRIFFACSNQPPNLSRLAAEIDQFKSETGADFGALVHFKAEGLRLSSQLVKLKSLQ